jgi:hypothetical protein
MNSPSIRCPLRGASGYGPIKMWLSQLASGPAHSVRVLNRMPPGAATRGACMRVCANRVPLLVPEFTGGRGKELQGRRRRARTRGRLTHSQRLHHGPIEQKASHKPPRMGGAESGCVTAPQAGRRCCARLQRDAQVSPEAGGDGRAPGRG